MERVAVIGLGSIAARHRRNLRALYPCACIYVVSASGRIVTETIENSDVILGSIQELIASDIDMAIVASPASLHASHSIPLLRAGIPVLIEKPISASVEDACKIADVASESSTPAAVAYCLRYLPSARTVRDILRSESIGDLYHVAIEVGQYLPDWRPDKDYRSSVSARASLGGGALLELSHELDYAQWLLGCLDVRCGILRNSGQLDIDVEDSADILAVSESGSVVSFHMDFLQRTPYRKARFTGTHGSLEWNLIENSVLKISKEGCVEVYSEPEWDKNIMYLDMISDFENSLRGKPSECASIAEAEKTVCLIDEVKKRNG